VRAAVASCCVPAVPTATRRNQLPSPRPAAAKERRGEHGTESFRQGIRTFHVGRQDRTALSPDPEEVIEMK